jgi:spermidine synthase
MFFSYILIAFIFITRTTRIITIISAFCAVSLLIIFKPDRIFREVLLPGIRVISTTDTPYGNVTRGEYGGEESLYYNNRLLQWHNDETEREENVHYAMLQHDQPENVLVVSGDINSILPEIMKYRVKKVSYVERDPELLKMHTSDQIRDTELLEVVNTDAYRFIHETDKKFDVILLVIPPPSTLLINRFYTTDFFRALRKKLNTKGVIMCSPGIGENYFNKESTVLYSSVFNSFKAVFRNVLPVVGNKLYYIASDDSLTTRICYLTEKRGIKNTYVNPDFLSDDLILRKSDEFLATVDRKAAGNTLKMPTACFHYQSYSLSRTDPGVIPSLFLLVTIFIFPVFSVKRRNLLMYCSAGALAGFEIIALLTLQSSAGNMYQITGLIIAGLMTGLALGTGYDLTTRRRHPNLINSAILILFYSSMVLVINKLLSIEIRAAGIMLIILLTAVPSFFTGQIFRSITEASGTGSSPSVYSADLAGSALAFIAVSGIAVPLLGISNSLFLLSVIIFTGFLFGTTGNK